MTDPETEGRRWLDQAENDLAFARHALNGAYFHQVCFACHQSAEKALKAVLYRSGVRNVIGHSVVASLSRVADAHPDFTLFKEHAAELDLFYIPTRYPNGLVEGTPYAAFTRGQADRALERAGEILAAVKRGFV